jgi:hypothetical protein
MLAPLAYRGPDGEGRFATETVGIGATVLTERLELIEYLRSFVLNGSATGEPLSTAAWRSRKDGGIEESS